MGAGSFEEDKKREQGWPLGSLGKGERLGCLTPVSVQRVVSFLE